MEAIPDLYAVLGVSPSATADHLRAAFRGQAKRCHPDAGGSHQAMVELLAAYEILSDPALRMRYDQSRGSQQGVAEQQTTYERARDAAETAYEAHGGDWQTMVTWMETRTAEIQADPVGRFFAAGVAGFILGSIVGALIGWFVGLDWWAGAAIGCVCGAVCGAMNRGETTA